MRTAKAVALRGTWELSAARGIAQLGHADRDRRRGQILTTAGELIALDLDRRVRLAEGDGLRLADGGLILVRAAEEACLKVVCSDPDTLARVAWRLGRRAIAVELTQSGLFVLDEPGLADWLRAYGAEPVPARRVFEPDDVD